MTIATWLHETEKALTNAEIETARLDALVLLSDQLGKDKSWLLAYSEQELQGSDLESLSTKVAQRLSHTPLAYVRGHAEFYGRDFVVNEHVLIPRPDSEAIIDVFKNCISTKSDATVVDIGTGSGALAITAKLERPNTKVFASDVDEHCLSTARSNAAHHNATVHICQGNLLEPIPVQSVLATPVILLCNLPYVPHDYPVNKAAGHEPSLALYGGSDGLDLYRSLFMQADAYARPLDYIITESLLFQHEQLVKIAKTYGYKLADTNGLIQLFLPAQSR